MIPDCGVNARAARKYRTSAGLLTVNNKLLCRDWPVLDCVLASPTDKAIIAAQVDKILASGVLGRSRFYTAMLEYLAGCAEREHTPKEIEIAAEVFNRGDGFDPSQDSMVRVYAHNLRQKLEQYYADQGAEEIERISIPKGEYRITVGGDSESAESPDPDSRSFGGLRLTLIVAASLVIGVIFDRVLTSDAQPQPTGLQEVVASALWAPVTDDDVPITVVVGDYYIFGELNAFGEVARMVRDFAINSSRDLDELFMIEPAAVERFIDLDLTYLPSSIAFAMRDLMSVLNAAEKEIRIVTVSNLDSSQIRDNHIVYIGYLSGLGILRDFVFSGSELSVGETFDELVHVPTGRNFISEAGMPSRQRSYRDYGLFSTLPAPGGNRFVFIAGTRDEGLMQTARAVTDVNLIESSIEALAVDGEIPAAFELLYEVAGLDRTNLDAQIVHAAALDVSRIANGQLGP